MIRAVIDTNILVSGLLSSTGKPAQIIQAMSAGLIVPCLSAEILAEYNDVLARPKFRFSAAVTDGLLNMLTDTGIIMSQAALSQTTAGLSEIVFPDPDDIMFVQCARAAGADYIVTGNAVDFPVPPPPEIMSPAIFLSSVLGI